MARTKSRTASSQQTVRMPHWAIGTRVVCEVNGTFARVLAFDGGKVRLTWENGSTDWYTADWLKEYRVGKAAEQSVATSDPRQIAGACVRVPSGDRAFVEGIDPKDPGRVLITYEAGWGRDSYPLHLLKLVQEGLEKETEPAETTVSGNSTDRLPETHKLKAVMEILRIHRKAEQWLISLYHLGQHGFVRGTDLMDLLSRNGRYASDSPAQSDRVLGILEANRVIQRGKIDLTGKLGHSTAGFRGFDGGKIGDYPRDYAWGWGDKFLAAIEILKASDQLEPVTAVVTSATRRLEDLEQTIQQGIEQIKSSEAAIWEAVAEVQQRQLWKTGDYSSFEDYCKKRWGWKKSNSFEVAAAGRIVGELKESGVPESALPTSVAQTRQIAKLPAAKRAEVVQTIAAKGEKLTAKAIKAAVEPKVFQRGDRVTIVADDDLNGSEAIVEDTETDDRGIWVSVRCAELSGMALDYRAEDLKLVHPANADSLFELGQLLERADGASQESDFVADLRAEVAEMEAAATTEPPILIPTKITPDQQVAEQLILQWDTSIVEVTKRLLSWCRKDELEKISKLLADEFRKKEAAK